MATQLIAVPSKYIYSIYKDYVIQYIMTKNEFMAEDKGILSLKSHWHEKHAEWKHFITIKTPIQLIHFSPKRCQ